MKFLKPPHGDSKHGQLEVPRGAHCQLKPHSSNGQLEVQGQPQGVQQTKKKVPMVNWKAIDDFEEYSNCLMGPMADWKSKDDLKE